MTITSVSTLPLTSVDTKITSIFFLLLSPTKKKPHICMSLIVSSFLTNRIVINYNLFEKFIFTYGAILLMHVFISFNNNHKHTYEFNFEILSMLVEIWLMDLLTHLELNHFQCTKLYCKTTLQIQFFEYIANIYLWILEFKFAMERKQYNFVSNNIFAHMFAMILLNNMNCFQACKVANINNDYVWVLDR